MVACVEQLPSSSKFRAGDEFMLEQNDSFGVHLE